MSTTSAVMTSQAGRTHPHARGASECVYIDRWQPLVRGGSHFKVDTTYGNEARAEEVQRLQDHQDEDFHHVG